MPANAPAVSSCTPCRRVSEAYRGAARANLPLERRCILECQRQALRQAPDRRDAVLYEYPRVLRCIGGYRGDGSCTAQTRERGRVRRIDLQQELMELVAP